MDESQLESILAQWQSSFERGEDISVRELTKDNPSIAPMIEARIEAMRKVHRLLDGLSGARTIDAAALTTPPDSGPQHASDDSSSRLATISNTENADQDANQKRRYLLLEEIARGGMGAVLKGRDTDIGRDIALKVLLEEHQGKAGLVLRFVEEAQIGGQLQHPGIVPVYELGVLPDKRPYFAMKLVKGETLAHLLAKRADVSEDRQRFLKVFEQVCQTLAYAHSRKVIHRDLKPANVMVGAFGEVQVMDWGLAKVLGETRPSAEPQNTRAGVSVIQTRRVAESDGAPGQQTQAGSVLGTYAYMPPEQALGEIDRLDERADVFGLGGILCEILTGKPPYVGDGGQVHRKARRADLADAFARLDASRADPELIALTKRCLAAEPEDRPRNANVLAQELTGYLESVESRLRQAELASAEARTRAAEERKRRKLATVLASAVIALILVGGGGWFYAAHQQAERERDTAARRADAARRVQDALNRAENRQQQARTENNPALWNEAKLFADQAKDLLAQLPTVHELRSRVQTLIAELAEEEKDRQLLAGLEEIWLKRADFDAQSNRMGQQRSLRAYAPLFATHGLRVGQDNADAEAWMRRRPKPTRERLTAGLDSWLGLARQLKAPEQEWLLKTLQATDEDGWRKNLRAAMSQDNVKEVERLAQTDELARQSPLTVLLLSDYVRPRSLQKATDLLRAAQQRHPDDFWINFALADHLYQQHLTVLSPADQFEEAVRYFSIAQALKPDKAHVQSMLGWSLWLRGQRRDGHAVVEDAKKRWPNFVGTYARSGFMHLMEGKEKEAESAFRHELTLELRSGLANFGLGFVQWSRGENAEALLSFRRANRFEPFARSYLAEIGLLGHTGRSDEAVATCQRALQDQPDSKKMKDVLDLCTFVDNGEYTKLAIACSFALLLEPNNPEVHVVHRNSLFTQDRLDEALAAARRAVALSPKSPIFPLPLLKFFEREIVQYKALAPDFDAYVKGEKIAKDELDLDLWLNYCFCKRRFHDAARICMHAFDKRNDWATNVRHERRFNAARFAIRAAAGDGDGAKLSDDERARLRVQALTWLRADLEAWRKLMETDLGIDRDLPGERLRWWQANPRLDSVRSESALAKLPQEQVAWRQFWADVAATLTKAKANS